jgi:deoxyribonuclease-1
MIHRTRIGLTLLAACTLTVAACARPVMLAPTMLSPTTLSQTAVSRANALRRAAPTDYYKTVEGLSGDTLLQALRQRIDGHTDLGYDGGRDVLFQTVDDTTDENTIVSVYNGAKITGITGRNSAHAKGFNTEHTWPQSLGAAGAAKADLHHLYASDEKTNGVRGSWPFGTVTTPVTIIPDLSFAGQASKLGTGVGGAQVFEPPNRHKGNVARALMYFFTRYTVARGGGPLSMRNFQVEKQVLTQWHKLDPVDDGERQRNDRIFAVQKNRNPYIDRPEFVEQVGGAFLPGSR